MKAAEGGPGGPRTRRAARRTSFQLPPGIQLPPGFQFPTTFGQAGAELDPLVGLDDASKPLRSKLLAVPALRAKYLGYVREIADKWLDWRTLEPLVRQYQSVIAADVKADTRKLYPTEQFASGVDQGDVEPEELRRSPPRVSPEGGPGKVTPRCPVRACSR